MSGAFEVISVNVSDEKGTAKHAVNRIVLDERGIVGDAHAGAWHRQVSVLSQDRIKAFAETAGRAIEAGEFAENLTIRGVDLRDVAPLDRFRIGDVELEVTQIGKACHGDTCAIYREVGECLMPKEGVFCRVVRGGTVSAGDEGAYEPHPFRVHVITLSDRAAAGEYEDRSGPRLRELLEGYFEETRWHAEIVSEVLPDDADRLRLVVSGACDAGADAIFTTGGTGVGPRDQAPETVAALCDKTIPGIIGAHPAEVRGREAQCAPQPRRGGSHRNHAGLHASRKRPCGRGVRRGDSQDLRPYSVHGARDRPALTVIGGARRAGHGRRREQGSDQVRRPFVLAGGAILPGESRRRFVGRRGHRCGCGKRRRFVVRNPAHRARRPDATVPW